MNDKERIAMLEREIEQLSHATVSHVEVELHKQSDRVQRLVGKPITNISGLVKDVSEKYPEVKQLKAALLLLEQLDKNLDKTMRFDRQAWAREHGFI